MKKVLIMVCVIVMGFGGVYARAANTNSGIVAMDKIARLLADVAIGQFYKLEALKVGGKENFDKLKQYYQSDAFKITQKSMLENALKSSGPGTATYPSVKIDKSNPTNYVRTAFAQYYLSEMRKYETLKAGGEENFRLLLQLYNSPGFIKQQTAGINSFLQQPTAAQPEAQAPAAAPTSLKESDVKSVLASARLKGNKDADIVIVEYTDIQCPFCQRHHDNKTLENIIGSNSKVAYATKHFPLVFHPFAQKSAEAAECANDQGKFYQYLDAVFAKNPDLAVDSLKSVAKSISLDTATFDKCLDSGEKADKVKANMNEGSSLFGVRGTPANIVINKKTGKFKEVAGAVPQNIIEAAIEEVSK